MTNTRSRSLFLHLALILIGGCTFACGDNPRTTPVPTGGAGLGGAAGAAGASVGGAAGAAGASVGGAAGASGGAGTAGEPARGGGGQGGAATSSQDVVVAMIGPDGGTLLGPKGAAISVPAGAVEAPREIAVRELGPLAVAKAVESTVVALPAATASAGGVVALMPHGASFAHPVTINIPFDPALAARATAGHPLELLTTSPGGSWAPVPGAQLANGVATAQVTHFSYFVVGFEVAPQPIVGLKPNKLDLLFMIDNSSSMMPLQTQLVKNLPDFMNTLKALPGGLPDLHAAVISSDMGAGASVVPGCARVLGDGGAFLSTARNPPGCTPPDGPYLLSSGDTKNYSGEISDAFGCIALLGQTGCGFESQLGSVAAALDPSGKNAGTGFLRDDALLGIVLLTNEDDCSTAPDSELFNPNMTDPTKDPLGALQSYRCTEFGITCDSGPPPHLAPQSPVTLTGCHSSENGMLTRVSDLVTRIKRAKADPNAIFVAAIVPPSSDTLTFNAAMIGGISAPSLAHVAGCEIYAGDNPIRLAAFVAAFGQHGLQRSICQDSYQEALSQIGAALGTAGALCAPPETLATFAGGVVGALASGCHLLETAGNSPALEIPACVPGNSGVAAPCYTLVPETTCGGGAQAFQISRPTAAPTGATLSVACE